MLGECKGPRAALALVYLRNSKKQEAFPWWLSIKEAACYAGDMSRIPGLESSLKKEMASHSSILSWEVLCTEEPDR